MAKLFFNYSTMNAGKSTILLQAAHNYEERGMVPYLLTAEIDNRSGEGKIASRIGIEKRADTFNDRLNLYNLLKSKQKSSPIACVLIDEAQFFSEDIVEVCNNLANKGMRIIIAGLDMDYLGKPFGPMPKLMAIAEDVLKVHAICTETGKPANFSFRKSNNNDTVMLGEKNEYEPLSREAFVSKMKNKKKFFYNYFNLKI